MFFCLGGGIVCYETHKNQFLFSKWKLHKPHKFFKNIFGFFRQVQSILKIYVKLNSTSILTRNKHPIVPRWFILFNIFGKTWNINTQICLGVLGWDNIPKIKYFYIWSTFCKNIFSWKIRNFQNPSYTKKFLYTYLLELSRLKIEALLTKRPRTFLIQFSKNTCWQNQFFTNNPLYH